MINRKNLAGLFVALTFPGVALAQDAAPFVKGKVTKVDAAAEKISIDHERIPNLDMDAMTMVFRAGDKGMLKQVKSGDRVQFTAERVNGQITVTKIQKAK